MKRSIDEMKAFLEQLIRDWKNETVEFKQASTDYPTDKIGEYFSALANEPYLRGREKAWLVFGIHNQSRAIVGSDYRPVNRASRTAPKWQLAERTQKETRGLQRERRKKPGEGA